MDPGSHHASRDVAGMTNYDTVSSAEMALSQNTSENYSRITKISSSCRRSRSDSGWGRVDPVKFRLHADPAKQRFNRVKVVVTNVWRANLHPELFALRDKF